MKIFKHPQFNICTCKKCGTVFQPEASDNLEYRFLPPLGEEYEVYTRCPTCEWYCEVMVEGKTEKLVRDKIPEIIEKSGKTAVTRILDDADYKVYLEKKLDEEVAEFHESGSLEELADIQEVIFALCRACGYTPEDLYATRSEKMVYRGGFKKKILLCEVRENDE